jgi:excinuclease UvrABC nuclease subunit
MAFKYDENFIVKPTTDRLFDFTDTCPFGPLKRPGVYAVCVDHYPHIIRERHERILYIGSSKNVFNRVMNEKHPYRILYSRLEGMLVYTRSIYCDDYKELEAKLIAVYNPLLNRQHNSNKKKRRKQN